MFSSRNNFLFLHQSLLSAGFLLRPVLLRIAR
jgi:hypothetical protein